MIKRVIAIIGLREAKMYMQAKRNAKEEMEG